MYNCGSRAKNKLPVVSWSLRFEEPIPVSGGRQLVTLRDAIRHFSKTVPTTVWIYVDTSKEVGDVDHLKVFASQDVAEARFKENDPEGVAFEYEVLE
ncbi:hypothetical protein [Bradyrhizobium sp. LMTR 3]|uniref:hypothetical protein n=1 Tax=Bradyrhizobium sp. LMTR 3 TaxID=189873 RepID=UPI0008285B82|nr:hypothetical protein [Bradyrhizobium sp. LMTR 3]OCK60600.1 hypothetical protein LMTR3_15820 [Bradyrhizobium sp. LMTR 3]